jgi:hypothetical protein
VQRVTAQDLQDNVGNILNIQVLATQVSLKVKLHKGIEFRNEEENLLSIDKTVLSKDIGNVTRDTEVSFEYRLKAIKELIAMEDLNLETLKKLPVQAQIHFVSKDGAKCIRVLSLSINISNDREDLERNADYDMMGLHGTKMTAKYARMGNYEEARVMSKAYDNKMKNAYTEK